MTMIDRGEGYKWERDKEGLGVWTHQGKVAIMGIGHSPIDRRWDGVSMDRTLGAFAMLACRKAMADAGVDPKDVDGVICCPESMAGGAGGAAAFWGPTRPYFDPPYDTEDGLSVVTGQFLLNNMPELTNVRFCPTDVPAIGEMMGMAAQSVADDKCHTTLVIYTGANFEGRYRRGGENASDYAAGNRQWSVPWGNHGGNDFINIFPHQQYQIKYGGHHDDLAPFVVNQHRNGLMNDWGFYTTHEPNEFTKEDYLTSRYILNPLRIWDCDRPVNVVTAYLFTTAERAKDMKQKPVYVLNHNAGNGRGARSSQPTLDDAEFWAARAARMTYEGSGLQPKDIDIFNPYDGYSTMTQFYLEAFGWHGVGHWGDAYAFYAGDITVEGPHPFCSGGGNLGNGRTRSAMYTDSIEQLRGTAGRRAVKVKAETAVCAFAPAGSMAYLTLSNAKP